MEETTIPEETPEQIAQNEAILAELNAKKQEWKEKQKDYLNSLTLPS